jgi:hypothetical protein
MRLAPKLANVEFGERLGLAPLDLVALPKATGSRVNWPTGSGVPRRPCVRRRLRRARPWVGDAARRQLGAERRLSERVAQSCCGL